MSDEMDCAGDDPACASDEDSRNGPVGRDGRALEVLELLARAYVRIEQRMEMMMATLADISTALDDLQGTEAKALALLDSVEADLQAAQASNDPTAIQAILDKIAADKATIAAKIAQDTPPAPAPAATDTAATATTTGS